MDKNEQTSQEVAQESSKNGAASGAQSVGDSSMKVALQSVTPGEKVILWDGESEHPDGILAVIGYGDYVQNLLMCRFLHNFSNSFSKVYFLVPAALSDLLTGVKGCDEVYRFDDVVPAVSHYITLADGLRNRALETDGAPYIEISDAAKEHWRHRIPDRADESEGLRIGLMWANEISTPPEKKDGAEAQIRDLDFALLSNFLRLPMHEFYSFQTGLASVRNQVHYFDADYHLVDLCPYFKNFSDIAGALLRMDLLITADSATAHLAAALGCNVWVLERHELKAWYWLLEEKQLPPAPALGEGQVRNRGTMWYRTMRLVQQNTANNWIEPLQTLLNSLSRLRRQVKGSENDESSDKTTDKTTEKASDKVAHNTDKNGNKGDDKSEA